MQASPECWDHGPRLGGSEWVLMVRFAIASLVTKEPMCRSAHPRNRVNVPGVAPAAHRGRICPHGTDHAGSRLPPEKTVGRRWIGAVAVPPAASHTKQRQARGFVLAFAGDNEPAVRRFSTEANARVRELASCPRRTTRRPGTRSTMWCNRNRSAPMTRTPSTSSPPAAPSRADLSRRTSGCGPSWPTPSGSAMPPHDGVDGPATIRRLGLLPRLGLVQHAVPGRATPFPSTHRTSPRPGSCRAA